MKKFEVTQLIKKVAVCISPVLLLSGCGLNKATSGDLNHASPETLICLEFDGSLSFNNFRKLDTNFVSEVCHSVPSLRGGLVAVTMIGEPTNESFLRCYLKPLPIIRDDVTLSKQAELKLKKDAVSAENEKLIHQFLEKVHSQIFVPINNFQRKVVNTDIEGVLRKTMILLDEPVNQNMQKIVFIYSDGVQSINGKDTPACFTEKPKSGFTLCLSGWKTKLPRDSIIDIKEFEDPDGFLMYLKKYEL